MPAVQAVLAENGIHTELLPPKMTDTLQPAMDLVVNGPLKAHTRRARCLAIVQYFQRWKLERDAEMQKPPGARQLHDFHPPKPTLIQGVSTCLGAMQQMSARLDFQQGLCRVFIAIGQTMDPKSGDFRRYPDQHGSLKTSMMPSVMQRAVDSMGDWLSEVTLDAPDSVPESDSGSANESLSDVSGLVTPDSRELHLGPIIL